MTEQELAAAYKGPTRDGVLRAMTKIADILPQTPLLPLEVDGVTIWCKAEMLQPIGAFKIRGAWHRLSDLNEEERGRGVVGVSSGNHAQGVAWAAKKLGIAATIVMPSNAPRMKLEATKALITGSGKKMAIKLLFGVALLLIAKTNGSSAIPKTASGLTIA